MNETTSLEEERDFLLRSLDDLEREYEAGDIDERDYLALRDDYTVRAATILRSLQRRRGRSGASGATASVAAGAPPRSRALLWIVATVVFAVVAGIAVAFAAGRRDDGQLITGEGARGAAELIALAEARMGANDPDGAIELFTKALALQPANARALTYRGWIQYRGGDKEKGRTDIDQAVLADPGFADARVFRTVILLDDKKYDDAAVEYSKISVETSPPIVKDLLEGFKVSERILAGRVGAKMLPNPPPLSSSGFSADEVRIGAETMAEVDATKISDAIKLLTLLIDANSRDHKARASLGWILGRSSLSVSADQGAVLLDRARRELDASVQIDGSYPYARVYRAFVALEQKKPADADADLKVFDAGADRPRSLLALIDQQGLREAIKQALGR